MTDINRSASRKPYWQELKEQVMKKEQYESMIANGTDPFKNVYDIRKKNYGEQHKNNQDYLEDKVVAWLFDDHVASTESCLLELGFSYLDDFHRHCPDRAKSMGGIPFEVQGQVNNIKFGASKLGVDVGVFLEAAYSAVEKSEYASIVEGWLLVIDEGSPIYSNNQVPSFKRTDRRVKYLVMNDYDTTANKLIFGD